MRSFYADGVPLVRTPSARQQAARRRIAVAAAVLALALVSGVLGLMTSPRGSDAPAAQTGPFSYFPTE